MIWHCISSEITTMISTHNNNDNNDNIFICYDNGENYDYYKHIEADVPSFHMHKKFGNFRIHGKNASTFHSGKIPNEYYCKREEAMTLRSGKKLNYVRESYFWWDAQDLFNEWEDGIERRCSSIKKYILFIENYYYLISTAYSQVDLYEMIANKLKDFIGKIESSPPAVYKKRNFEKKEDLHGPIYMINHDEPMPTRKLDGYVFCNCHYTVIKDKFAIEQCGTHQDEYLHKLNTLLVKYSRPHRRTTDAETFNIVTSRTNGDCAGLIFSFIRPMDVIVRGYFKK